MGKEIVLFSSEERTDKTRVSAFLRELADRIDQNSVVLKKGEEEHSVDLPDDLVLEVKLEEEAKGQGVKYSLEVELEWTPGGSGGGRVSLG